jgi:hypothetical protein
VDATVASTMATTIVVKAGRKYMAKSPIGAGKRQ